MNDRVLEDNVNSLMISLGAYKDSDDKSADEGIIEAMVNNDQ